MPVKDPQGKVEHVAGVFSDVTERKQAEIAFEKSEERFRQLAGAISEVFWLSSMDRTKLYYISPAFEDIWGRTCESIQENPKLYLETVHPDDRAALVRNIEEQQTPPLKSSYEEGYRIHRPDGEVRWISTRYVPMVDAETGESRIAGVAVDITERKRSEEALRQTRDQYVEAQTIAHFGHWHIDLENETATLADETYRIFGLEPDSVGLAPGSVGLAPGSVALKLENLTDMVSEEDRPDFKSALEEALGGKTAEVEYRILRPDGEERWIHTVVHAEPGDAGNPRSLAGIVQDISERRQAQKALEQAGADLERRVEERTSELEQANAVSRAGEKRLRALLEAAPDALVVVDGSGKIVLVNVRVEQLFGYVRDELIGKSVDLLVPSTFRDAHAVDRRMFMAAPKTRPLGSGIELKGCRRDGTEFPVEISLSPTRVGEDVLVMAMVREVSDPKSSAGAARDE